MAEVLHLTKCGNILFLSGKYSLNIFTYFCTLLCRGPHPYRQPVASVVPRWGAVCLRLPQRPLLPLCEVLTALRSAPFPSSPPPPSSPSPVPLASVSFAEWLRHVCAVSSHLPPLVGLSPPLLGVSWTLTSALREPKLPASPKSGIFHESSQPISSQHFQHAVFNYGPSHLIWLNSNQITWNVIQAAKQNYCLIALSCYLLPS